eukprot:g2739.t1
MRSENAERVAEAGGVQLVVLAMKTHHLEANPSECEIILAMDPSRKQSPLDLMTVSVARRSNCGRFGIVRVAVAPPQLRGVPLLFRALLHPCGAVASALHAATCSLLAKLAADGDEYQALVLEEGGITAAVRSATIHAADPQVQVDAFDLLQNLVGRPLPTGLTNLHCKC